MNNKLQNDSSIGDMNENLEKVERLQRMISHKKLYCENRLKELQETLSSAKERKEFLKLEISCIDHKSQVVKTDLLAAMERCRQLDIDGDKAFKNNLYLKKQLNSLKKELDSQKSTIEKCEQDMAAYEVESQSQTPKDNFDFPTLLKSLGMKID